MYLSTIVQTRWMEFQRFILFLVTFILIGYNFQAVSIHHIHIVLLYVICCSFNSKIYKDFLNVYRQKVLLWGQNDSKLSSASSATLDFLTRTQTREATTTMLATNLIDGNMLLMSHHKALSGKADFKALLVPRLSRFMGLDVKQRSAGPGRLTSVVQQLTKALDVTHFTAPAPACPAAFVWMSGAKQRRLFTQIPASSGHSGAVKRLSKTDLSNFCFLLSEQRTSYHRASLDYCSSLPSGCLKTSPKSLQLVQNFAARVQIKIGWRDISPICTFPFLTIR